MLIRTGIFSGVRLKLWCKSTAHLQRSKVYFSTANERITSEEKRKMSAGNPTCSEERCVEGSVEPFFGPFPPYSPPSFYRHDYGNRSCLQKIIEAPEKFEDIIYWRNKNVVVVYNKFPKSKVHLVVVSTRCRLGQILNITKEHLPHIKEISAVAEGIISRSDMDLYVKEIVNNGHRLLLKQIVRRWESQKSRISIWFPCHFSDGATSPSYNCTYYRYLNGYGLLIILH